MPLPPIVLVCSQDKMRTLWSLQPPKSVLHMVPVRLTSGDIIFNNATSTAIATADSPIHSITDAISPIQALCDSDQPVFLSLWYGPFVFIHLYVNHRVSQGRHSAGHREIADMDLAVSRRKSERESCFK